MSQTVRTNLATNPRAASTTGYAAVAGTGGTAALSNQTSGGPTSPNVATFNRVTWSVATTAVSGGASYTVTGLAASTAYAHQVWVRSSKAQTVALTVQWQTSGAANVNSATGANVALTANTWTQVTVTGTSGASVTQAVLTAQAVTGGANWASGDTFDITAVLPEAGSVLGSYFDGSFTNAAGVVYAWTGTANASTSTATTYVPAIALAPATDSPCPRVVVTLTDLTPTDNVVNLWRTADGTRTAVRGTTGLTVNGSTAITDYEAPLGRNVAYDLEVVSGVSLGAVTPTSTTTVTPPLDAAGKATWWIQDPLVPGSAMSLSVNKGGGGPSLTATAVKDLEYTAAVSIIPILGSALPVAIGGQRLAAAGVDFSTFTRTATAATNLRDLLAGAAVLLVRPPDTGREAGLPALCYTAIPKAVEQPVTVAFGGTLTKWQLTGSTVAAPTAAILVPVWTYGNVQALWNTYQDAQSAYTARGSTYLDVLRSPTGN